MAHDAFQFQVDNRPAAPVRDTWDEAADDAVSQGFAVRTAPGEIKFHTHGGGAIARGQRGDIR